jgi:mono/diheme cytochrome c family protein
MLNFPRTLMISLALLSPAMLAAQGARSGGNPLPPAAPVYDGGQLFTIHCAPCHGVSAQGNGPMATAMRKPPADLTKFAMRNGGIFPAERLRRIIDGREIASHGDREMPVWGVAFRTIPEGGVYGSIEARIDALVKYLASLQERSAH